MIHKKETLHILELKEDEYLAILIAIDNYLDTVDESAETGHILANLENIQKEIQ